MTRVIRIRGEAFVTLETVADCYRVELGWVREVYDHGLLGPGEPVEDSLAVAAEMLDRVGRILRLHHQLGVNLAGIVGLLDDLADGR